MTDKIKEHLGTLSTNEKIYAGTVVPLWVSFVIYLMIGVPILAP
jgi:hypothetical protein